MKLALDMGISSVIKTLKEGLRDVDEFEAVRIGMGAHVWPQYVLLAFMPSSCSAAGSSTSSPTSDSSTRGDVRSHHGENR